MSDFSDVVFVWGETGPWVPTVRPGELTCWVGAWPVVLGCEMLHWDSGRGPDMAQQAQLRAHRIILVNLFGASKHVTQARAANPSAFIVAMPDPPLEYVLRDEPAGIFDQLAAADAIAGRTQHGAAVYGALFGKPAVWLPSPIGPLDAFQALWDTPKAPILLACEHNGIQAYSGATIAALALVQRETGCDVHFYRANERTRYLAERAGLLVEWKEAVKYPEMARITAGARWGIDLYPFRAQGRNLMTHAMAGTPVAGSNMNNLCGAVHVDPFCPAEAAEVVLGAWDGPAYETLRRHAAETTESLYGFEASRRRMAETLEALL